MNRPKVNTEKTDDLTAAEWKELRFTGCVVKGDRIIRTLAFMQRVENGARKEIAKTAARLFA